MASHALGPNGEKSLMVRRFTEFVIGQIHPKAYDSEILAIRNLFVQPSPRLRGVPLIRYTNDPLHVEFVKTPERLVREIHELGSATADCDEFACLAATMALQIGRKAEFVAMGFAPRSLSHVAVRVQEPKSGKWILLDGVAGPREREAASKAVEILTRSLE